MLEIKDVTLTIAEKSLFSNLSIVANTNEILCITGPSGVGKSLLLNSILGFYPISKGFITLDGYLLQPSTAEILRQQISYIPQEINLPYHTIEELVKAPYHLKINKNKKFSKERLFNEWNKLNLDTKLYNKQLCEISGGEKQRIMLASAIMMNRRALLADEPTSALDRDTSLIVAHYLREYAQTGKTIIAVTHDEYFAAQCHKTLNLITLQ